LAADVRWHIGRIAIAEDLIVADSCISRKANGEGCLRPEASIRQM